MAPSAVLAVKEANGITVELIKLAHDIWVDSVAFSQIGRLHDLGLDYLKVDASFIHGLESNAGNQAFLKGLSTIAHGIGLRVIGEGVNSAAEFRALGKIGFDGATGPAVTDPLEAQPAN